MGSVTVSTRDELEAAKNAKASEILVVGKLAEDLKKTKKITKIGKIGLAAVVAAVGLTPFTGGLSGAVGLGGLAAVTGMEVAAIILAASIGIGLLVALSKDYDEIDVGPKHARFRRKAGK
ncbi:hypothetical protein VDS41_05735 [Xanthomonas campestris pv. campestris]|nr:hypothetical protein [Xanthomonas campestris pv. campestris]